MKLLKTFDQYTMINESLNPYVGKYSIANENPVLRTNIQRLKNHFDFDLTIDEYANCINITTNNPGAILHELHNMGHRMTKTDWSENDDVLQLCLKPYKVPPGAME